MNEPQINSPESDGQADVIASLRRQVVFQMLALIVVSGTITLYLSYQSLILGRQLATLEPQARVMVENYNNNWPQVQKMVQELIAYGQQHPDFQPILKKYGIPLTPPPATSSAPKQ